MTRPPEPRTASETDEQRYRQHFLQADAFQASIVLAVAAMATLALLSNDRQLFGSQGTFWVLVAVRAGMVAAEALGIAVLLRSSRPRVHDAAIAAWIALFVASNFFIVSTRPPEYLGHGVVAMIAVDVIYFVMPGPLLPRAAGALLVSGTTFWFVRKAPMPPIGYSAMLAGHAISHALGIPLGWRYDKLRRQGYFARLDEQRAHEQEQRARAEERRAREELARKAEDLEAAKERAEQLAKAKSEFLATMSHEFRTPMNAVLGLTDILADTRLAKEQRELVTTIHDSARSLLVLLNDILDLSTLESGTMALEDAPLPVREVVQSAVDVVAYHASEKGLCVELSFERNVPAAIAGDAARLRQILVGLLSNAIKFSSRGTIDVTVACSSRKGAERELLLRVRDQGAGMSPEVLARLFEPLEPHRTPDGDVGLGLALVKRLVDRMGGSIRVESKLGAGSTFEISLLVREVKLPPPVSSPVIIPFSKEYELRILLVEDNVLNQRVAAAALARLGCRADIANNGVEAVSAVASSRYDVVLMDLRMPLMGGIEAAKRIIATQPAGRCPHIIALTANAFDEDRNACREAGMSGFVSKPVQIEELYAALRLTGAHLMAPPSGSPVRAPHGASARPPEPRGERAGAMISKEALDKLRALEDPNEPGFFVSVCRQFVGDAEKTLARASDALSVADTRGAERAVHTLKSMSASVGAMQMSARCAALEAEAKRGDISGLSEGIAELREELIEVERALSAEVGGPLR